MSETTTDPQALLFAALAKLQTELPVIAKDSKAKTPQYTIDYADLTALSQALMPLLGKNGLAFTSFPTLTPEGKFVLAYSLTHAGGGKLDGQYPLTSGNPQAQGSAITYARRYCLCAVTGASAGGEDDDGIAAENAYRHQTGQAPNGNGQRNGSVARPAQRQQPQQQAKPDLGDWGIRIDEIASDDDAARLKSELDEVAGKIGPARANAIWNAIKARRSEVIGKQGQLI
jgi:ERF superfamily